MAEPLDAEAETKTARDKQEPEHSNHSDEEHDEPARVEPVPSAIPESEPTEQQQPTTEETQLSRDRWRRLTTRINWIYVLNIAVAAGAFCQAYFAYRSNELTRETITLSRESTRREQRAHLYVVGATLNVEPSESDDTIIVKVDVSNVGRTAAYDVTLRRGFSVNEVQPPRPNWDASPPYREAAVLHPEGKFSFNIPFIPEPPRGQKPIPRRLTPKQLAEYRAGERTMFVVAFATYTDTFRDDHWVETCLQHKFGTPLNSFSFCKSGNDTDRK